VRISTKINLAMISTVVCAVAVVLGNLFIVTEQFKGVGRTETVQRITYLSSNLLVLTQEFVLFRSPSVQDSWYKTRDELEQVLKSTTEFGVKPQELVEIQNSLAELKPIFRELTDIELPADGDFDFAQRRQALIVERLIAETQLISEQGYQWAKRVNETQRNYLQGLTLLESLGLGSFVLVIGLLVTLIRGGLLNPLARLKQTAEAIRNGDENAVCDVSSRDEIGDVARAVNRMTQNLAHKNKRLREVNALVENASKAKTEFLSNMSHEIRTPLNGIVGLTYLLKDTSVSSNQKMLLESLEKTSRNLIDLISDVLDISKIEAGSMQLESRAFSTQEFIDKIAGIMTGAAASKPVELMITPAVNLPEILVGDELRLRQIVVNLVGNAIKFTPSGHVHLSIDWASTATSGCLLHVEVQDTGVGISPENQAKLFQQFYQAHPSVAREFGGSGLGLSLVKNLVGLMQGTMGFSSEPGKGSVFWVDLEFDRSEAATDKPAHDDSTGDLLLVTENSLQANSLAQSGQLVGRRVVTVNTLTDAAQWIERGGMVKGVVLDFPQAGIDRLLWIDFVKQMGVRGIPCAVLLGSEGSRRLLSKGISEIFSAMYVKPMTPLQIKEAFNGIGPVGPLCGGFVNAAASKLNLLIVDDSELNLKVLDGILRRKQANITKAKNGLEALSFLLQFGHGFDAVVMDIQMPLMDGLEATRELRRQPFNADLPIIGLTGEVSAEDEKRALEAGMNAVLHKPLQPEDLMFLLNKLVKPVSV
jgi:signal transduction histidine kinase/CheY-like chemotaxis protein